MDTSLYTVDEVIEIYELLRYKKAIPEIRDVIFETRRIFETFANRITPKGFIDVRYWVARFYGLDGEFGSTLEEASQKACAEALRKLSMKDWKIVEECLPHLVK